ncbi:TPA: hypothetical protein QDC20_002051 [Burkholderia aenigmatica]|uniref:hypothetical protein n=1 Tax=Burkholderia sp. AU45251 TaxID=3059204 RepID=UPI00264D3148|nr:hypothetical protein [Burkholderia sp. AU45251]HDR9483949.1 hypothetical protein [Burkholderia aenigmatica]MDN7516208.1 hypothetical protein [Burkholderia sp. AU45251]HDR9514914.1 hypothetical protein [Burkholderia aenigmatica]HDR9591999.1 hypothetical protein [Burkholderia aenigmatica]HDR9601225.1 hypothetical protein [Burkholderia aenigmatica]
MILAIADDRARRCDRSSINRLAWKDSERNDYCETGAPDAPSAGIVGNGTAALFAPLPVAPAEFVVPVCPRRPRCAPRTTGGALAATGRIGGCAMYWKFSLIALLPVSYDRCTNTLLVTDSLACANAGGMADIIAAAAALNAAIRTSEPASRTVGRTVTLRFLQCASCRRSSGRPRRPPEKIGPHVNARAKPRTQQHLGGVSRRDQSSPSRPKENFRPNYSYYSI